MHHLTQGLQQVCLAISGRVRTWTMNFMLQYWLSFDIMIMVSRAGCVLSSCACHFGVHIIRGWIDSAVHLFESVMTQFTRRGCLSEQCWTLVHSLMYKRGFLLLGFWLTCAATTKTHKKKSKVWTHLVLQWFSFIFYYFQHLTLILKAFKEWKNKHRFM